MKFGFNFGCLAKGAQEQAKEQGLFLKREGFFDDAIHAMNILRINGILADSEYDKCCKRLMKEITKNVSRLTDGVTDQQEVGG